MPIIERRREERIPCSIHVSVTIGGTVKCSAEIIDLSLSGACILFERHIYSDLHDTVTVTGADIGYLEGKIRWRDGRRVGVDFRQTTDHAAKILSYQRKHLQGAMRAP